MRTEKFTDVAIAVDMLVDALEGSCDTQVLVTGDSDLVPGVKAVKAHYPGIKIVVYVPDKANAPDSPGSRAFSTALRRVADECKWLPKLAIKHAQFPDAVALPGGGAVRKPKEWYIEGWKDHEEAPPPPDEEAEGGVRQGPDH